MDASREYSRTFYADVASDARTSAQSILPPLLELFAPSSVVDVGCGTGAWLAQCLALGVPSGLGLDGTWVPLDDLEIPRERFELADLSEPLSVEDRFDMAICVEVAEHLPARAADSLVAGLTALAPVVLFSASVPGQRGSHHVNEQWPGYWFERFAAHGFTAHDIVRPRVWDDPRVAWWYAQNAVVYVSADAQLPPAARAALDAAPSGEPRSLVHPGMLAAVEQEHRRDLEEARSMRQVAPNVLSGISRFARRSTAP
jgi:SAM-dependent methyltransferase